MVVKRVLPEVNDVSTYFEVVMVSMHVVTVSAHVVKVFVVMVSIDEMEKLRLLPAKEEYFPTFEKFSLASLISLCRALRTLQYSLYKSTLFLSLR